MVKANKSMKKLCPLGNCAKGAWVINMSIKAAVVVIKNNEKILAVSRKDNYNDWGLPGGKIEENETPKDTAIRETKEETGLTIHDLTEVFISNDNTNCLVTAFIVNKWSGNIKQEKNGGAVDWVSIDDLLNGSFGEYNKKLFKKINLIL